MLKHGAITTLIVASLATTLGATGLDEMTTAKPGQSRVTRIPAHSAPREPQIVKGELLVKYKEADLPPFDAPERAKRVKKMGERLILQLFQHQIRVVVLSTYPKLGIQRLKLISKQPVASVIDKLHENSDVEVAEPNYKATILGTPQPTPPDDPKWTNGDLWGMVKIGMNQVWNQGPLVGHIVVAVIDTGIDYTHPDLIHPDLSENLWTHPLDGNYGPNYCNNGFSDGDPLDDNGHGTAVAGTIAAVGNNARNVAGLNWQVKIMAVKSFCHDGTGNTGDIIAGIYYAVNSGATIINNSWSIGDVNHQGLRAAIEYANLNHVLFVSGAGNERNDNDAIPQYPASYPLDNVMAVAATSETDQLWIDQFSTQRGSNWGTTSVHIAAPGEGIFSLYPVYLGCVTNPPDPDCAIAGGDGTSMAAPHVAGCAALLQANRSATSLPALLPKDLKTRLMAAGDEVNSLNGKVVDARRLNCKSAIYPDTAPPEAPINLKIK